MAGTVPPIEEEPKEQPLDQVTTYDLSNLTWGFAGYRYNPDELASRRGLKIYQQMLTDEQVKAVVEFKLAAILSRGYQFVFDGSKLSPEKQEERSCLFQHILLKMRGSFMDALEGIASGREYGFSITEKVYGEVTYDGSPYVGINQLLTRDPSSFLFKTDAYGNLVEVKQQVTGQQEVIIDQSRMIHYVHAPKWDAIYGRSDLRAAHRSWYAKDNLVKLELMYLEKFGGGTAVAKRMTDDAPRSGTPDHVQLEFAIKNISSLRSIVLPKGVELEILYPNVTTQFREAITYHDLAIAKALLVPNLLGLSHTGQTGAFAQSQTQLQAFFWTLNTDANRLEECLNEQLFRDLGDQNWGDGDYPRFKFKKADIEHTKWIVATWKEMLNIKAVLPTEDDEKFLRELLEMPERDENSVILENPVELRKEEEAKKAQADALAAQQAQQQGQQDAVKKELADQKAASDAAQQDVKKLQSDLAALKVESTKVQPITVDIVRAEMEAALRKFGYNPDQPRDGHGRFGEGGGSDSGKDHETELYEKTGVRLRISTVKTDKDRVEAVSKATMEVVSSLAENPAIGTVLRRDGVTIEIVDGKTIMNEAHGTQSFASYNEATGTIKVAAGLNLSGTAATPSIGKFNVGTDFRTVLAHEIGHAVSRRIAVDALKADPNALVGAALYKSLGSSRIEKGVSGYAAKNAREFMAEAFAAYTHPGYSSSKGLPKEVEHVFELAGVGAGTRKFDTEVVPHGKLYGVPLTTFQRATMRVNFQTIEQKTNTFADSAVRNLAAIVAKAARRALGDDENMKSLLDDDPSDVAAIDVGQADKSKLRATYRDLLNQSWKLGANLANNELARARGSEFVNATAKFASLLDKASQYFDTQAFRMAGDTSDQVRKTIQQELQNGIKQGKPLTDVRVNIWNRLVTKGMTSQSAVKDVEDDDAVNEALDLLWADSEAGAVAYLNTLVRTNTFEALNEARYAQFTDPELGDFVVALRYAAVLDSSTTNICEEMDGKEFTTDNPIWDEYRPPNHFNCRSILVPITAVDGWDGKESPEPSLSPQEGFK